MVIPEDFNLRERIALPPWEMRDGSPLTVRIRFEPDIAWMFEEGGQGSGQFELDEDGSGIMTLKVTDAAALVRWVAQYGSGAVIESPEGLRDLVCVHFDSILDQYGEV